MKTIALTFALLVSSTAHAADPQPPKADRDMQAVLDKLAALGGKPIAALTPDDARKQPTPADAAQKVAEDKKVKVKPPAVRVEDRQIPGAAGMVAARIYTPDNGKAPMPVIVYFHGGGWVIADLDVYDATPRALAAQTGAIVIAADYRRAPEFKFPAAHEDAFAAWKWAIDNAHTLSGDPTKMAVAGESAGGNLAINVALRARDANVQQPRHMLLVYPVAGNDMTTPSYVQNAAAKPLDKPMMEWFVKHVFASPAETADPRINLVARTDLAGLPSATVITAEIDPLRSEGKMLADALKKAGVKVDHADYAGVTHEFFGMAAVVADAKTAQARAAKNLKAAFK